MQSDEAEYKSFEVLHKIIENSQAFRIRRLSHVVDRADLGCLCAVLARAQAVQS